MASHLATSDLSVKSLLTMLGVATPKAIFYNGSTLRTAAELGAIVNKLWLGSACPGASADLKLATLLADRRLSYFKGYGYDDNLTLSPSYGVSMVYTDSVNSKTLSAGVSTTVSDYAQNINSSVNINIGGTWPGFTLYIRVFFNNVEQPALKKTITGLGNVTVSLGANQTYPTSVLFSISSS